MKQPSGVGRDGFEIAALGFRIERAERQRRFPRTGDAGENHERVARNIERNVLEIVLARAADAHEPLICRRIDLFGLEICASICPSSTQALLAASVTETAFDKG